ncbi:hypothetical protein KXD40_009217 [Peronospora effusa]|uniref:Uncharacterized protein n=1 Tax=Peronospora effusa TaxID=542832 RepID=A0A3M6VTP9_9STRA|nr:hypothetical protein DD238_000998 [Peronospora effusa]UIZ28707.1 hypothetical protein KXD40_009217 [Peronospora effusa]
MRWLDSVCASTLWLCRAPPLILIKRAREHLIQATHSFPPQSLPLFFAAIVLRMVIRLNSCSVSFCGRHAPPSLSKPLSSIAIQTVKKIPICCEFRAVVQPYAQVRFEVVKFDADDFGLHLSSASALIRTKVASTCTYEVAVVKHKQKHKAYNLLACARFRR